MADPLEALRRPIVPLDPDPSFAARLRSRLTRALMEGDPVTAVVTEQILVPYLAVHDAHAALDWYADVFGAEVVGAPIVMPDGRIGHAEIIVAGATIYLADDYPEIDAVGPVGRGTGTTVSLHLTVPSVDSTVATALRHRAHLERPPADQPYGRTGVIRDPFGHRWMIQSPVGAAAEPTPPADGDLAFFSLHVPSADRAREFYSAVLGWSFGDPSELGGFDQVMNLSLPAGVWDGEPVPGVPNPGVHLVHHVSDIDSAVAKVRALGGTATDPEPTPYGLRARCTDDQGNGFSVVQTPPGAAAPAANGERAGDLAYITIRPGDEQRAATFYGGLFSWQFTPGRVEHGLQVQGPMPMAGLWGGESSQNVSLMYRVDDVAAAVAKVRELGGQATDPERQPYGVTSDCVDNQGMTFYLGEM